MLLNNLIHTFKTVKTSLNKKEYLFTPGCYADANYVANKLVKVLIVERDVNEFVDAYAKLSGTHTDGFDAVMDMVYEVLEVDNYDQFEFAMSM